MNNEYKIVYKKPNSGEERSYTNISKESAMKRFNDFLDYYTELGWLVELYKIVRDEVGRFKSKELLMSNN